MKKNRFGWLLLTLIALLLFSPVVSALAIGEDNLAISKILRGNVVFPGEKDLDVSDSMEYLKTTYHYAINHEQPGYDISIYIPDVYHYGVVPTLPELGWNNITVPSYYNTLPLYLSNDGIKYLLDARGEKIPAFTIENVKADISLDDSDDCSNSKLDVFYRGQVLKYRVDGNLHKITERGDYAKYNYNFNILTTDSKGNELIELMTIDIPTQDVQITPTTQLHVNSDIWLWPAARFRNNGWWTEWRTTDTGQESDYQYPTGTYSSLGIVTLNGLSIRSNDYRFQLLPFALRMNIIQDPDQYITHIKERDVGFTVHIEGLIHHRYQIFIYQECPPKMTGKICDRPPFITGARTDLAQDGIYLDTADPADGSYPAGEKHALNMCRDNTTIRQAVPSGDEFPSKGDWEILDDGTRYYADLQLTCDPILKFGVVDVPFWIDTTVKPGTYTIQVQEENGREIVTGTITIVNGIVNVNVNNRNNNVKVDPITGYLTLDINDELIVSGKNTDSNTTYLWLTGPGLPPCGVNLRNIDSDSPEIIRMTEIVQPNVKNSRPNWDLIPNWVTNTTPIGPGKYTLWVASGNPDDQGFCSCAADGCKSCNIDECFGKACETGVCALEKCPHCLATTNVTLIFKEPEVSVDPINETERCCCDGASCGKLGGVNEIMVRGNSTGNYNHEVRFWIFGPGQFGQKNYLTNLVPVYCDCDYTNRFEYDLNRYLFQENGLDLCEITSGTYDILVQAPGTNGMFDIRLGDKGPTGDRFILTTLPTDDSRSFLIEGKDALFSQQALKSLKGALDVPGIDDLYVHKQFVILDKPCDDNIEFTADRTMGNAPLAVVFKDLSKIHSAKKEWYANDELLGCSTSIIDNTFRYTFDQPGKYTIRLDLKDPSDNIIDSLKKDWYINVLYTPEADFSYTPDPGVEGVPVQFIDESKSNQSSGAPTSWMWDFNDGTTSSLQSPSHIFVKDGTYKVTLSIGNANGVGTSITKDVQVGEIVIPVSVPGLQADFDFKRIGFKTIKFTDMSVATGGASITSWTWDFMDGVISHEQNPVHEFLYSDRYYHVTLTVSDGTKSDVKQKAVYVF